jgi:single-strand DNA-binding protein
MYQQITLIGNLGNDPEMRYTPSGVAVASFNLAINRSWTGQDGQRNDKTTWFRVSVWNKQAETVTQYLSKGRLVLVVGEVEEARAFTDRDGNQRASLEVKANSVRFLGQGGGGASTAAAVAAAVAAATAGGEVSDEDIPF